MSNPYTKKRSDQLGMAISTARSQLLNRLLFRELTANGECKCHRCGQAIKSADDLSIDHKEPWMNKSNAVELFFDLENISYSHRSCNSSARRCALNVRADSGFKGVMVCKDVKRTAKYKAVLQKKAGKLHIGYYMTAEEAAAEYDKVALRELGDRAVTNKMLGLIE